MLVCKYLNTVYASAIWDIINLDLLVDLICHQCYRKEKWSIVLSMWIPHQLLLQAAEVKCALHLEQDKWRSCVHSSTTQSAKSTLSLELSLSLSRGVVHCKMEHASLRPFISFPFKRCNLHNWYPCLHMFDTGQRSTFTAQINSCAERRSCVLVCLWTRYTSTFIFFTSQSWN